MIEHSITLKTSEDIDRNLLRAWFHVVRDNSPSGALCTVSVDGKAVQLIRTKEEDSVRYSIPLTRDLTTDEVKKIINDFSHRTDIEFKISATTSPLDVSINPDVVVDHDPMIHLCTKWAKDKHEGWRKIKEDDGWRYGPTVSKGNKTHPLLRPWDEIPGEHRKVDTKQAQELLNLLRDSGYVLVHKDDLDKLMGD